jgi:UDP-N-acetylglucosamine acyltransferase
LKEGAGLAAAAPIHSTAVVHPAAQVDASVQIGPYAVIGPHVHIAAGTTVGAHCVIEGHTRIGQDNHIFQFASVGTPPQDKKYAGEPTALVIGDRNTIREFCTINTGTAQDRGVTTIGDDNWIMAYVHVAHDCSVGNGTVLANNATLAGHVRIDDFAIIGGLTGIHQFTRVGAYVMAGFASHISQDVPPFMMVDGNPLAVRGLNTEGLRRRGFSSARVATIKQMHRLLYRQGLTLAAAREAIASLVVESEAQQDVQRMLELLSASARGIVR